MIEFETLTLATPTQQDLEDFKRYASVPDGTQDALLLPLLTKAMMLVQSAADKSILAGTFRVTDSDRINNLAVKLYQTPGTIISVTDGEDNSIGYSLAGRFLIPDFPTAVVKVKYSTNPNPMDAALLLPSVWQYATALFDGADAVTLANILRSC